MTGGTSVIAGWFNALVTWGVILAVAAVIVSAGIWALGSIRSTPSTMSRGKWGVLVAIVATMLLGGSKVYLQVLYDKWAPGFRADPASYQIADTPAKIDRYQVVDRSADWDAEITRIRATAGLGPVTPDPQLTEVATACAKAQGGAPNGMCPFEAYYKIIKYTSATVSGIDGLPTAEQLKPFHVLNPPPNGDERYAVKRAAWVAVKDNETKHAVMVVIIATDSCDGECVVDGDRGDLGGPIIAHITGRLS